MSLSSLTIRRPVLSIVFSLLIVIFGIVSFTFLEVREYPSVDPPIVTVTTSYTGANAEVMESQITEPLEQSLNGIEGIRTLSSTSRVGISIITIEFNLGKDLEQAANDVRDRVSRSQRQLPKDVDPPTIEKADADASAIIFMFVQSDSKNILEVNDFAENVIKERVQTIEGVSSVNIQGQRKYAMRMWLDPDKMAAYNLTPIDVQNALNKQNVELPSGSIEGNTTELTIKTFGRLQNTDEFNNLVIKQTGDNLVRFKDIGNAILGAENERTSVKLNGIPGIGVSVTAQPGANNIAISNEFKKRFEQLKKDIPPEYKLQIGFDYSDYVRTTISEVEETILIAFGLVILIIFLFLRDWRSTIIPVIAIPVSIISAFFIMYAAGFSINVLTLVGIILAIGLVVDDAIVVLENIYSKIEEGMSPIQAAYKGSKEIYFAVISTTITLAAVFLPILFLQGVTGRLFREFGVVIAGSVLVSAFVALTLTPMLSSKMLKKHDKHNWFYAKTEPFFLAFTNGYKSILTAFLKIRWMSIIIVLVMIGLIFLIGGSIQSELAPLEDRSNLRVQLSAPEGTSYDYMDTYSNLLAKNLIDSIPEISIPVTTVASGSNTVNTGNINLYLTPPDERKRTQAQIYQQIAREITRISEVRGSPSQPSTIGSRGGQPVQFVIQTSDFDSLENVLPKFLDEANQSKILQFADANLKVNNPQINLTINREKAIDLGVAISDISQTLQTSFGGQRFGYFFIAGKQYQVIGQVQRDKRDAPLDLKNISVRSNDGKLVQLDNLVYLKEDAAPTARYHFNRYVSATVTAGLAPGYTIGDGIQEMQRISAKVLSQTFTTALAGQSRDFAESSSSLAFTFIFVLVLIFLVLAAQFESFIDPFIILLTVPLAMTGALITLWLFNQTLNIFSEIGIIMLTGLVTKNAILIVEFANQKKEEGMTVMEAVMEAGVQRFRPILMTSIATVLGALPIALGSGSRTSLGIAVVGGLLFATFLTLFIVPAIYSFLSRKEVKVIEAEDESAEVADHDLKGGALKGAVLKD